MNKHTSSSLKDLLCYWKQQEDDSPFKDEAITSCTRLLDARCPLNDEQLEEYFDRLGGPEGCNFHTDDDGEWRWTCFGGNDKRHSEKILREMDFGLGDIELMHEIVDELGGHCDCEILFNAAERMLGE